MMRVGLVFVSIIFIVLSGCAGRNDGLEKLPFNKEEWLKGDRRVRGQMVDNLIADSLLIGKSKSDVVELLGDPTASDTTGPIVYIVDPGLKTGPRGVGGTWLFYLTVQFDSLTNRVFEVHCGD
jgi:hypothetical protein